MVGSGFARKRVIGSLLGCAVSFAACAAPPVPPEFQEGAVEESEFRIAPADVVAVRVWKNAELSVEAPVLPDGTLTVPLAGALAAKGLTAPELEDAIAEKLSEYITAPEVSVIVMQVNSKRVSVIGEVNRAGPQNVAVNTRIMDVLASSGGFTPFANRRKVRVIRRVPEREVVFRFDYDAFRAGRAPGTNVLMQPGDTIVVPD